MGITKRLKRILLEVLIMAILMGSIVGLWFLNSLGPWKDWKNIKVPYLSWTGDTATTMTISYQTPEIISTIIQYGTTRAYTNFTTTSNTSWHNVTLTNLKPSTTYYYRILSLDFNYSFMNSDYHFTTGPSGKTPFRFVVYGDHRPDNFGKCAHEQVVGALIDYHPDFVLNVGDVVLDASGNGNGQWDRLFYEWRNLAPYTPIMIGVGNHEFYEGESFIDYGAYYRQTFHFPGNEMYYAFNYSNAHFIALNLSIDEHRVRPGSPEYLWFINDLAIANSSPEIDWIFIFFHVPLFSSGGHGPNEALIADLQYIFDHSSVDVVLQGHDHHYERIKVSNITYMVIGGGGAEMDVFISPNSWSQHVELVYSFGLFEIDGRTFRMQAIRIDGYVFDALTIIK